MNSNMPGLSNVNSPLVDLAGLGQQRESAAGIGHVVLDRRPVLERERDLCPTGTWMLVGLNLNSDAVIEMSLVGLRPPPQGRRHGLGESRMGTPNATIRIRLRPPIHRCC